MKNDSDAGFGSCPKCGGPMTPMALTILECEGCGYRLEERTTVVGVPPPGLGAEGSDPVEDPGGPDSDPDAADVLLDAATKLAKMAGRVGMGEHGLVCAQSARHLAAGAASLIGAVRGQATPAAESRLRRLENLVGGPSWLLPPVGPKTEPERRATLTRAGESADRHLGLTRAVAEAAEGQGGAGQGCEECREWQEAAEQAERFFRMEQRRHKATRSWGDKLLVRAQRAEAALAEIALAKDGGEPECMWRKHPRCAHCGAEYEEYFEQSGEFEEGDVRDIECPECGKPTEYLMVSPPGFVRVPEDAEEEKSTAGDDTPPLPY